MNSLNTQYTNIQNNLSLWAKSKPVPDLIDSLTYNLYEDSNPFNRTFDDNDISDKRLRAIANAGTKTTAEIFSAFANPYYLSHKFTHIPVYYKNSVNLYENK